MVTPARSLLCAQAKRKAQGEVVDSLSASEIRARRGGGGGGGGATGGATTGATAGASAADRGEIGGAAGAGASAGMPSFARDASVRLSRTSANSRSTSKPGVAPST